MKSKRIYKYLIIALVIVVCVIATPMTFLAYNSADEFASKLSSGQLYYGNDSEQWYCSEGEWYKCDIIENNDDLSTVAKTVRTAMLNKQPSIVIKAAIRDSVSSDGNFDGKILDYVYSFKGLENNLQRAQCGDYLEYQTEIDISMMFIGQASAQNSEYDYYVFNVNVTYNVTLSEQEAIDNFYAQWQKDYILNNEKIRSITDKNEKEYYIVKTIYNYAVSNICYDKEVYEGKYPVNSERYRYAHNLYGATFGNLAHGELDYYYSNYIDSSGLTRIKTANQGLSVCEGYSFMIYYLCQLNGIDCRVVQGDYPVGSSKYSDPHAWNVVSLCDNSFNEYKWFNVDATFAANSFSTLKELKTQDDVQVDLISYDYFLRGYQSEFYANPNHQTAYSYNVFGKPQTTAQALDYKYAFSQIDTEGSWVVVSRRPVTSSPLEVENYHFISPDGRIYRVNSSHILEECANTMAYDGTEYYYSVRVQDYAPDIEYTFERTIIKNAGNYSLLYSIDGSTKIPVKFEVLPLDMSVPENYKEVLWQGSDIHNLDVNSISNVPFTGANLSFTVSIKDKNNYEISDYSVYIIDMYGNVVESPSLPGGYKIVIDFNREGSNYTGQFVRRFDIIKTDMSHINVNASELGNLQYGENLLAGSRITSINNIPFYEGVDYSVSIEDPSKVNYGDEGNLVYTALPTSDYFIAGTQLRRPYKINRKLDISSVYNGKQISGLKYTYSGSPIVPNGFNLNIILNGQQYELVENRDYVIISCRNNVAVGTAYVTLGFTGNFTGVAEMSYIIEPMTTTPTNPSNPSNSSNPSNAQTTQSGQSKNLDVKISVTDSLKYTGKPLQPDVSVVCNGNVLTLNKDYTVSSIGYQPNVYRLEINGCAEYSAIKSEYVVFVEPGNITGLNASTYSKSIQLKWDDQGGAASYEVYCYDSAKKKWRLVGKTNKASYKVSTVYSNGKKAAIAYNKNYKFRVRALYSVSVNSVTYNKYGKYKEFSAQLFKKTPTIKKLAKGKNQLTAYWAKYSGATGYEIECATDKNFKKNKTKLTVSKSKTNAVVKKLKAKKTYYVRVRAYKTVNGVKVYTGYSSVKKIKL